MIFLKDLKGHYLHFNRKLAEVFHLSPEKHVGKRDVDIYPRNRRPCAGPTTGKCSKRACPWISRK